MIDEETKKNLGRGLTEALETAESFANDAVYQEECLAKPEDDFQMRIFARGTRLGVAHTQFMATASLAAAMQARTASRWCLFLVALDILVHVLK